jgi:FtsP/CotA-like multicopper oxidase with cupredoxin domain
MTIAKSRATWTAAIVLCVCSIGAIDNSRPTHAAERIVTNDNRVAAGTFIDGTLTVKLEAKSGEWHPDGDAEPGVTTRAFAVEGEPLQIPGPLLRVREGTSIHVLLRNLLDEPLDIHGLYSRPGSAEARVLRIAAGETGEITFLAGKAGTYFYWGTSVATPTLARRLARDTQLSGAFIVDPAAGESRPDRILIAGFWNNPTGAGTATAFRYVINGRSWPGTERLTYQIGDVVRLRLINAGVAVHPMHLHGFYFNVDSRGNEREDDVFAPGASPHMVVTERMPSGATFALTWTPTRPGNWLFHCHDNAHLQYGNTLDGSPSSRRDPHRHVENHALEMMSGPIIGITVTGKSTEVTAASGAYRRMRLIAQVDSGGTDREPAFAYSLEEGASQKTSTPKQVPGPTILLKRGQPVAITVVNELTEPTSVHWHGIELESYYDGVAGFAGSGTHIAPAIEPGGTFEARFTPPRSGTFIYHTHIDEVRQQQAGLSGPLIVVDDPSTYDPRHDMVIMVTVPRTNPTADVVLINGSPSPPPREMRAGERYRLRFINVHTFRPNLRMRALEGSGLTTWKALAKDGRDLPADQAATGPAETQMGNGETYDFEFVPAKAGDLRIDVTTGQGVLLASLPIHVR